MENARSSKVLKVKALDDVISPINVPNFVDGRRFLLSPMTSIFDPYASDSSDSPSPLMKYLRAAAPAIGATIPSPLFNTSMKVEEDVLVMDGIPVPKSNEGGGRARGRSILTSLNLNSISSSLSGSGGTEPVKLNKTEKCRKWEDSGICRFGSKCQFAHSKEELRPPRLAGKNKPEIFTPHSSSGGSTSSPHGRMGYAHNQMDSTAAAKISLSLPSLPSPMIPSRPTLQTKPESGSITGITFRKTARLLNSNWSPQDDGIEVTLPAGVTEVKSPSKEDVDAHILKVLCGTSSSRRLQVFSDICVD